MTPERCSASGVVARVCLADDVPVVAQPSGTVTLVFTDVEGSSTEEYRRALAQHRSAVRQAFGRHQGYEVDCEGDAFFYAFESATAAVMAVQEAIDALASGPIRVRVGIHTGEPVLDPPQYVGMDVHRAARIMAAAHGGQVVLSHNTRDLLEAPDGLRDLGEHRLKDLGVAIRLYQLGDEEYPPLRSLYRTNLPVPTTPFVGRERELAEIVSLLGADDVWLVTLTGPGGTGKTRLALRAAAEASEDFPEGLTWVPLAPLRDPALLLAALAQALDVKEQRGHTLIDALVARLSGGRRLLLFDNAEHLLPEAAGDLARLRGVSGVTLLVTSRERLQLQGEQVWTVSPLDEEDGRKLFTARARALEASFTASSAVIELCRRLDNLPLALELAAARTPLFTPEQLLERLGQRLDLLKAGRDAEPRQQTLRATIAWSHELLDEKERQLFRRLAVFVGGCTYEAAEAVCEAGPDTLQSLLDKSLLRRSDAKSGRRYWMLETIREFAAEQLQESEEAEEQQKRHADYFLRLAEETESQLHGPAQTAHLDQLDTEQGNLRAALGSSSPECRLRLAAALSWFWQLRSYLSEGLGWLERALHEVEEPTMDRARALDSAGRLAFYRGNHGTDRERFEESASLLGKLGNERARAQSLAYLGITAGLMGDADTARTAGEQALATSRAVGDEWTQALALWGLGMNTILGRCGPVDAEAGVPLLKESASLFEKVGDKWGRAAPLFYLGLVARGSGDQDAAQRLMSEAVALLREVGDKFRLMLVLHTLGDLASSHSDWAAAQAFYEEALEVSRDWGAEGIADVQVKLALTALGRGNAQDALELLSKSLGGYRESGSTEGMLWVLEGLSYLAAHSGDRRQAAVLLGASQGRNLDLVVQPDPANRARLEAELRAELGEERFEAARAEGAAMNPDEAIELALSGTFDAS
jgi:predicted ATPase/class 3 adenylate cyclase